MLCYYPNTSQQDDVPNSSTEFQVIKIDNAHNYSYCNPQNFMSILKYKPCARTENRVSEERHVQRHQHTHQLDSNTCVKWCKWQKSVGPKTFTELQLFYTFIPFSWRTGCKYYYSTATKKGSTTMQKIVQQRKSHISFVLSTNALVLLGSINLKQYLYKTAELLPYIKFDKFQILPVRNSLHYFHIRTWHIQSV